MTKNPCAKECPERNSGCHATCERYLEYYEENARERAEKYKKRYLNQVMHDHIGRNVKMHYRKLRK